MSTKQVSISTLGKGSYIILDGAACKISELEVSKSGKHGHAKARVTAVGLLDNKKRVAVMPGHDNVEVPIVDKRSAQVLSISGDMANVMDSETYETFDLAIPDDLKAEIAEGANVLYWTVLGAKVMKQVKPN